jgi:hypothetical protein
MNELNYQSLPGAIFVSIFEFAGVLAEHLLALFACKDDLSRLEDFVILLLSVALGTVEPELAALCADLNLSVQNVFAHPSCIYF